MFTKPKKVYPDLKLKREKLGVNRAQFARIAGVADATIARAENGNAIRADIWKWIDEALNG